MGRILHHKKQRIAKYGDGIVVEFRQYDMVCTEIIFKEVLVHTIPPSRGLSLSLSKDAKILLPANQIANTVNSIGNILLCDIPLSYVTYIAPMESNKKLLIELEYKEIIYEIICSSIEYKKDNLGYSYYYNEPILNSPLLDESCKDLLFSWEVSFRWDQNSSMVYNWYPLFNKSIIRKISILREDNVTPFLQKKEEEEMHSYCWNEIFDYSILSRKAKELLINVEDDEKCLWGIVSSDDCIGETWKKGPTGDYIYEYSRIFYYKAFPTKYSMNMFLQLLCHDKDINGNCYDESVYCIKDMNCELSVEEFFEEYDFSYIGGSYRG